MALNLNYDHPIVKAVALLNSESSGLPGLSEQQEHNELLAEYDVVQTPTVNGRSYISWLNAAETAAHKAAEQSPVYYWRQTQTALEQASQVLDLLTSQTAHFTDHDQDFLREKWQAAQRSLDYAQQQIAAELNRWQPAGQPEPEQPAPASVIAVLSAFLSMTPYDQALFSRVLIDQIAAAGEAANRPLPNQAVSDFYEAATCQMEQAASAAAAGEAE